MGERPKIEEYCARKFKTERGAGRLARAARVLSYVLIIIAMHRYYGVPLASLCFLAMTIYEILVSTLKGYREVLVVISEQVVELTKRIEKMEKKV